MNSNQATELPFFVRNYFAKMDKHPNRYCQPQWQWRYILEHIFKTETLIVHEERARKYFGLDKYLGFRAMEWEEFCLGCHLCVYKTDGQPRWPTLFCMLGRGSGKDGCISLEALSLISPYNPVREYDVDICANNEDQSLRPVKDLVAAMKNNKAKLSKWFKWKVESVEGLDRHSFVKGHTNNAKGKDGLRSGCVIFNEYHQYENTANINVFTTGLGKKPEPRRSIYTTNGNVVDGPLDDLLKDCQAILDGKREDRGLFPFICRLDSADEVDDPECWYKASPSLEYFPHLMTEIKNEYAEWKENPARLPDFMTKRMNWRVSIEEAPVTSWDNIASTDKPLEVQDGWECICGIDFSKTTDWMAVNLHFKYGDKRYDINHAWICMQSPELHRIKAPYEEWARRGLVTLVYEPEISPEIATGYIQTMMQKYNIKLVACDYYRFTLLRSYLEKIGFSWDLKNIRLVRPSNIMRTYPIIDRCFANQWFYWGDQPCLRWATNNTKLVRAKKSKVAKDGENDIGNFIFGKIEPKSRKTDPFMALVHSMCYEYELSDMEILDNREYIPVFTF